MVSVEMNIKVSKSQVKSTYSRDFRQLRSIDVPDFFSGGGGQTDPLEFRKFKKVLRPKWTGWYPKVFYAG